MVDLKVTENSAAAFSAKIDTGVQFLRFATI
jgi:hypothetical protein